MKSTFRTSLIPILFGLIVFVWASPQALAQDSLAQVRKLNFPKTREVVETLPSKDSLYIFLMAGQSNMAGRGLVESADTVSNPRILTLDSTNTWIYAKEPLHWYEPNLTGLDCGLSFAQTLLDSLPQGVSIAIIPCAVGGSSIEQWLHNETYRGVTLLDNFKEKVAVAQEKGVIKGILWHQGEANSRPNLIPLYAQRLDSLLMTFRTIVQNDNLPIVLGELGSFSATEESRKNWSTVNSIIHSVVSKDPYLGLVETGDLSHKGDQVHFDSESQRKMGSRYAAQFLKWVKENP